MPPSTPTPIAAPISEIKPELGKHFQGFTGAFTLYDLNHDRYVRYNPARCAERFLPASTFKIMNSLIGLESGVIPNEDFVIPWDGTQYDISTWNQDHTLKTALQNSVVWYYQELARRVGTEKMQQYLTASNYGNQDISGAIDSFWLEGGLRISADEQVELLKQLYQGSLPFSQRSMRVVKELLILEKTEGYRLSGKTGTVVRVTDHVGWFVGYVEVKRNIYFFATNIESQNLGVKGGARAKEITQNILRSLDLLP